MWLVLTQSSIQKKTSFSVTWEFVLWWKQITHSSRNKVNLSGTIVHRSFHARLLCNDSSQFLHYPFWNCCSGFIFFICMFFPHFLDYQFERFVAVAFSHHCIFLVSRQTLSLYLGKFHESLESKLPFSVSLAVNYTG